MKNRKLLCLFLAVMMTVPVLFSGCGSKENNETTDAVTQTLDKKVTLNMFILTEKETKEEDAKAVQTAINEITLPKYKTALKINYLTEDKYWAAVEQAEADVKAEKERKEAEAKAKAEAQQNMSPAEKRKAEEEAKKAEKEAAKNDTQEAADQELNKLIDEVYEKKDIELTEPQVDIFLVNNADKYRELVDQKRIVDLSPYLTREYKILSSYIYPTYLSAAKMLTPQTYGIPVNGPIGEYEYFVFDKELLDKYGFDASKLTTFETLGEYLSVIKAKEPGVIPLKKTTSPAGFYFYGEDGSAIGTERQDGKPYPTFVFSMFEDGVFKKQINLLRQFRLNGYLPSTENANARYAVDIRKGTALSPEQWEKEDGRDYECVVYKNPIATNENILGSEYVISSLSTQPDRAMEILELFTKDEQIINLLQYGIEGTHYFRDKDKGTITLTDQAKNYKMNKRYTGNLYLQYRIEGEPDYLEAYKKQNLDSTQNGFMLFNPKLDTRGELIVKAANEITKAYYPSLLAGTIDTTAAFTEIKNKLALIDVSAELAKIQAEQEKAAAEKGEKTATENASATDASATDAAAAEAAAGENTEEQAKQETTKREGTEESEADAKAPVGNAVKFKDFVDSTLASKYTSYAGTMNSQFPLRASRFDVNAETEATDEGTEAKTAE